MTQHAFATSITDTIPAHPYYGDINGIDLFAGPGGWEVALKKLGIQVLGIEFDKAACQTAAEAGHLRLMHDVSTLDPHKVCIAYGIPSPTHGQSLPWFVASPPCQTFSAAGKGDGRKHLNALIEALNLVAGGVSPVDAIAQVHDEALDVRSVLVLEPMRWIRMLNPERIIMEQVASVQPIWDEYTRILRLYGYNVATGCLTSEQYDAAQTRKRAILIASRVNNVTLPTPTRRRYKKGLAQREALPGQEHLDPWISMAEALGWGGFTIRSNYAYRPGPVAANDGDTLEDTAWVYSRPAPTMVGSFAPDVAAAPGWRKAGDGPRQKATGSVRVTVQEAAVLQTFPIDYPWQGSRTAQYRQVGDAVPPALAWHVARAAMAAPAEHYPA